MKNKDNEKEHKANQKKEYYKRNKEKIREKQKTRYQNNKEEISEQRKKRREINKNKIKEQKQKYYQDNKEEINAKNKEYRKNNKDKIKEQKKIEYIKNKENYSKKAKIYRETNKEEINKQRKKYRDDNKIKIKESDKKYKKNKLLSDPCFKLKRAISSSIYHALKSNGFSKARQSSFQFLPYTKEELKIHLENLFEAWMNWDNWGLYNSKTWDDNDPSTWKWNLDHIVPHSTFNYDSMEHPEFKECWDLSNLRPYSAKQNLLDGVNRARHK